MDSALFLLGIIIAQHHISFCKDIATLKCDTSREQLRMKNYIGNLRAAFFSKAGAPLKSKSSACCKKKSRIGMTHVEW